MLPEKKRGRPRRGEGTIKRSVTLQQTAWGVVDARAAEEGRSASEALERIILDWAEQARKE